MATSRVPIAVRLIAMAAGVSLLFASGACSSSSNDTGTNDANTTVTTSRTTAGTVAVFTPSDGITISQRTPLNKWAKLVPEITNKLVAQGVRKNAIDKVTSDDLDKQSRDVQDWVVDHMTASDDSSDGKDDSSDPSHTTLVVAPAVSADASTRQYGDYVTQPSDGTSSSDSSDPSDASSSTASSSDDSSDASSDSSTDDDSTERNAYDRLRTALKLARDAGMHVVLLSNGVDGFSPDAFVRFSTPEQIGMIQATKLVTKLDLAKASKNNPKAIEVLIPHSSASADSTSSSSDASSTAGTETDDAFAREAFAGMWKVLQPYFSQGKAYSPSGLLTKDTRNSDWRNVTVSADDEKDIRSELDYRLPTKKGDSGRTNTRIDGIIAMNDYIASVVTDELDSLGYTGSAADINPSITISGIVGNITGKKDLQRGSVPDPAKAPESDDASSDADESATQDGDDSDTRWPIVTGFGGYIDTMPQVVNGKQWMTGLENRKALAADIAEVAVRLNRKESVSDLKYVAKQRVPGSSSKVKVDTITEEPLSVSAYNLKTALIDPGYITMADAGL